MALGTILITAVPTPAGNVSSKYRDGDDSAASPPTDPQIGQPNVLSSTAVDIPLLTASTGGTAPLAYELSLSTTSGIAGFSVTDANADFSGDGVYSATGLTGETQYWVRLACVDTDGRRSGYSGTVAFTTLAAGGGDVTAPTAPSNLAASSTTAGRASLTWTNGTDAVGIAYTDVIRGNSVGGAPTNSGTVIDTVVGTGSAYTDVSAPSGSEVFYRVQHRDAAGNVSTQSDRVFITIASASSDLIRFAPGHYFRPGLNDEISATVTKINSYGSHIKGVLLLRKWKLIETSKGVYSWSDLDAVVNACVAKSKKLLIRVQDRAFGTSDPLSGCPTYLQTEGLTYANTTKLVAGAALWRSGAMDYNIGVYRKIVDRYGDDTILVGLVGEESTFGPTTGIPADYSASAVITQEIRRLQALRAYAPQLPYYLMANYLPGDTSNYTNLQRYFAAARADFGVYMCGGPDLLLNDPPPSPGQDIILGTNGGINHIGPYLSATSTESKDFTDGGTVATLYSYAYNTFRANIMSWSTVNPSWASTVEPYLATHPVRTTVPTNLVGLVTQL